MPPLKLAAKRFPKLYDSCIRNLPLNKCMRAPAKSARFIDGCSAHLKLRRNRARAMSSRVDLFHSFRRGRLVPVGSISRGDEAMIIRIDVDHAAKQ